MLNIAINLETGQARPAQAAVIKAGGVVPVEITFSESPGEDPVIELALSAQSSTPAVVAYLDVFAKQNDTTYTGVLDANDTRLIGLLAGKAAQTLDCEIVVTTTAGGRQPFPNFPVTAQQPVITGPESSEGGPVYLTEELGDARYLPIADPVTARADLGIANRIRVVALPADEKHLPAFGTGGYAADVVYIAKGAAGLFLYLGDGSTPSWMQLVGATRFTNS